MSEAPMIRAGETAGWPKLVVTYETDPAGIAALLPPGIEPIADDATVTVGVYRVPVSGEPEHGVSIKVPARWNGVDGQFNLGMGIDQEQAVHISAERNGQPKFLCEIDYYLLGDQVRARATHQGYTFVEYAGAVVSSGPAEGGIDEHEWWVKYSRAIGGAEGEYDFPPHVVDVHTTFERVHVSELEGELTLRDSPWDPVAHYLPVTGAVSARLVHHRPTSRAITNAGPLDPVAFWARADVIGGSRWPGTNGGPRRAAA